MIYVGIEYRAYRFGLFKDFPELLVFNGPGPSFESNSTVKFGTILHVYEPALYSELGTLMVLTSRILSQRNGEYQFKNAIMTLASEAAVPDDPQRALEIFYEILHAIVRVKYYRPKKRRPTQPRVTKRPPNKWCVGRREKLSNA